MKRSHVFIVTVLIVGFIAACSSETKAPENNEAISELYGSSSDSVKKEDPNSKGIGKFQKVELTHPLDKKMIEKGSATFDVKCNSCHKLTDEKLVGPGWKGVTDRRKPEWIMNFATNTDEMLDKDANAKAMIEVCMVRMPNQNLSEVEARQILEFMRKNDGKN